MLAWSAAVNDDARLLTEAAAGVAAVEVEATSLHSLDRPACLEKGRATVPPSAAR